MQFKSDSVQYLWSPEA